MKKLIGIDLFAGAGGLSEGILQSGNIELKAHVEWEMPMVMVLRERLVQKWNETPEEALEKVIDGRIEQGSVFVTDSLKGYQKIAFRNDLTHVRIPRGKHKSGAFNINTVNSYHSELKRLTDHYFKGVATKYLNNYIVYNNFVNFYKDSDSNKLNILEDFVFSTNCLTRGSMIKFRSAIPV